MAAFDWGRVEEGSALPNRDRVDAMADRLAHAAKMIGPMAEQLEALAAEARADPESTFGASSASPARSPAKRRSSSARGSKGLQRTRQNLHGVFDDATVGSSREGAKEASSTPALRSAPPHRLHVDVGTQSEVNASSPVRASPVQANVPSPGMSPGGAEDSEDRVRAHMLLERASSSLRTLEAGDEVVGLTPRSLNREKIRALMPWNVARFYLAQRREERADEDAKRGRTRHRRGVFEAKQRHAGRFMADPKNRYRVAWDLCVVLPLLCYIVISMPFRCV